MSAQTVKFCLCWRRHWNRLHLLSRRDWDLLALCDWHQNVLVIRPLWWVKPSATAGKQPWIVFFFWIIGAFYSVELHHDITAPQVSATQGVHFMKPLTSKRPPKIIIRTHTLYVPQRDFKDTHYFRNYYHIIDFFVLREAWSFLGVATR